MVSRIRRRITYTNVAVTLALFFAMTGGAYAAKNYVINSTNQIKPSVLKALQGKAGPAGPAGAQGPQGLQGAAGTSGAQGEPGSPGADGQSVTSREVSKGVSTCGKAGGTQFSVSGGKSTLACNGKEGPEGSPWTDGGTLPSGATETGVWTIGEMPVLNIFNTPAAGAPISFAIPLEAELAESAVTVIAEGEKPTAGPCAGGSVADPKAEVGNLCIFVGTANANTLAVAGATNPATGGLGASVAGAQLIAFAKEGTAAVEAAGTWAVTGG
jgi:hypothetical protein